MSAFEDLAAPAPRVESAVAESAIAPEEVKVEPALPSEDAIVEPAQAVEPAVTSSNRKFAPVISRSEAACLSVTALRSSGSDFEGKVSFWFISDSIEFYYSVLLMNFLILMYRPQLSKAELKRIL